MRFVFVCMMFFAFYLLAIFSHKQEEIIRSRWLSTLLKKLSTDGYDVDTSLEDADKKVINSLIKLFAV